MIAYVADFHTIDYAALCTFDGIKIHPTLTKPRTLNPLPS